jgi:CubicO group peptidase (beta-lactamase class C family)
MSTFAAPRLEAELLERAYAAIAEGVASGRLPSGVLAIGNASGLVRLEAFGPVTTDSIFLIASITKPIFSTAVMRLVERARVLLNDRVAHLLPEFAANGKRDVRLWHLLTHTSGLDESITQPVPREPTWTAALAHACAAPLLFRPGTRYSYCNMSFFVMAELIQRLTGQDHVAYLCEKVLDPLGMRDTQYVPGDSARVVAVLNPPWSDDASRARWIGMRNPAGGLWSTAADLVRFGRALLLGGELDGYRLIAPATLRSMTSRQTVGIPQVTATGEFESYYGLGFGTTGPSRESGPSAELRTTRGFGHGGATGTYLWIEPQLDLVFVFLTNQWGIDEPYLGRAMNAAVAAASCSIVQ